MFHSVFRRYHGAIGREIAMSSRLPMLAMIALVGFAVTPTRRHCKASDRRSDGGTLRSIRSFSMAWGDLLRCASDHHGQSDVSDVSMNQFEQRHREAMSAQRLRGPSASAISAGDHPR
jgi:hypothetical protein